jgi:hypothetical protein
MRHRSIIAPALLAASMLSGCVHRFVPAPFGTPLDEVCNPMNGVLSGETVPHSLAPAVFSVPKGWSRGEPRVQEVQLTRIDAELVFWRGGQFIFPAIPSRNGVRCTIQRGDTVVSIQAARVSGFDYRVDVAWQPPIDGQLFYMQLQTRYVDHLKQMRGIIESVRFVSDSGVAMRGVRVRDP